MTDPNPSTPSEGYARCIDAMQRAARAWLSAHPFAELQFIPFEHDLARAAGKQVRPGERIAVVAALPDVIARWAGNADTAAFLRAMDEASHGEATYLQARAIVEAAVARQLERASGQMPAGRWTCVACNTVLDGFTQLNGADGKPDAGSLTVCGYCGALQKVAADSLRFEPLPVRELNALPKSLRQTLLAARRVVEDRRASERARS